MFANSTIPDGQKWLMDRMEALGYRLSRDGVCHGNACMAMQAVLAGDVEHFNKRLQAISAIPIADFALRMATVEKKRIEIVKSLTQKYHEKFNAEKTVSKNKFTKAEQDILNIVISIALDKDKDALLFEVAAYFDGILLSHNPCDYPQLYEKNDLPTAQSYEQSKRLSLPVRLLTQSDVNKIDEFCSAYDHLDIAWYFESLRRAINECGTGLESPIAFLISNSGHKLTFSYDPKKQSWLFFDTEKMIISEITEEAKIAALINSIFGRNDVSVLYTEVYAHQQQDEIRKIIDHWQSSDTWKLLHSNSSYRSSLKDCTNGTLLFLAAMHGLDHTVTALLKHHEININFCRNGFSPLSVACQNQHHKVVEILLKDARIMPNEGENFPLFMAARNGNVSIVRMLLAHNKIDFDKVQEAGVTPFFMAAQNGHSEVVKLLLENNADPNQLKDGLTPIYLSAQNGHYEIVKLLLAHNADPNLNKDGTTPIYIAAKYGHDEIVKVLLAHNADPNLNKDGVTPLYMAAQNGHMNIVKLLLTSKLNPNITPICNGQTPLIAALSNNHFDIVELLLSRSDIDTEVLTPYGWNAFHYAVVNKQYEMIEVFLKHPKLDPDAVMKALDNDTPLMLAIKKDDIRAVGMLLVTKRIRINVTNKIGHTPLCIAVRYGNLAIIKLLLQYGANPCSISEETLKKYSQQSKYDEIIYFLRETRLLFPQIENGNYIYSNYGIALKELYTSLLSSSNSKQAEERQAEFYKLTKFIDTLKISDGRGEEELHALINEAYWSYAEGRSVPRIIESVEEDRKRSLEIEANKVQNTRIPSQTCVTKNKASARGYDKLVFGTIVTAMLISVATLITVIILSLIGIACPPAIPIAAVIGFIATQLIGKWWISRSQTQGPSKNDDLFGQENRQVVSTGETPSTTKSTFKKLNVNSKTEKYVPVVEKKENATITNDSQSKYLNEHVFNDLEKVASYRR